jgi:hypothetical protein
MSASTSPPSTSPPESVSRRLVPLLVVLVVFAVAGVVAGVIWHALWTPPSGVYFQEEWVVDAAGAPEDVGGTALYVVVALVAGLLVGFAVTLTIHRDELAVLAAVAVGSALAAAIMALTGHALGPTDPRPLGAGKEDFTPADADLRVEGASPYVAFPAGALSAAAAAFLLLANPRRHTSKTGWEAEPDG